MWNLHYILNDNNLAIPASLEEWGRWLEEASRTRRRCVAQEDVGPYWVSTVFLGIDMGIGNNDLPILFETMIFSGDKSDLWMDRCGTWEEAIDMHEIGVAQALAWMRQLPVEIKP